MPSRNGSGVMAGGDVTQILPPWGRWQRAAVTERGVLEKAAAAASTLPRACPSPPLHRFAVPLPQGGRI